MEVCVGVIPIFRNEEPHFSRASRDRFAYIEIQERKKLFLVDGLVLFTLILPTQWAKKSVWCQGVIREEEKDTAHWDVSFLRSIPSLESVNS